MWFFFFFVEIYTLPFKGTKERCSKLTINFLLPHTPRIFLYLFEGFKGASKILVASIKKFNKNKIWEKGLCPVKQKDLTSFTEHNLQE